jgi:hypothetical protein
MNSRQCRTRARIYVTEITKLLPDDYNRELTAEMLRLARRIEVLENQLMRRDGYVMHISDD